jgi:hypothetical protein
LRRCIDNVFRIIPPGAVKVPSKARLYDAQINIQAFVANVYGIVDNLTWIWVYEQTLSDSIPRQHVLAKRTRQFGVLYRSSSKPI